MAGGAIGIVSVFVLALLAYNVVSDGGVTSGVKDFAFSPEDTWSEKRASAMCLAGQILYQPSMEKEVLGTTVRIPKWELGDLFLAIFITLAAMVIINLVHSGRSVGMRKSILIFIAALIVIKLVGWILIQASGSDCSVADDASQIAAVASAGIGAAALVVVYRVLRLKRGL